MPRITSTERVGSEFVNETPGTICAMSRRSRVPCRSSSAELTAMTGIGTSCERSVRFSALTTTSSSVGPATLTACAPAATGERERAQTTAVRIRAGVAKAEPRKFVMEFSRSGRLRWALAWLDWEVSMDHTVSLAQLSGQRIERRPVEPVAVPHHSANWRRVSDVCQRILVEQQQIGPLTRGDRPAPFIQEPRRFGSRRSKHCKVVDTRLMHDFKLAVQRISGDGHEERRIGTGHE